MFTEKPSKSNLIIITKEPRSLFLLTLRQSSVGVFCLFMLVYVCMCEQMLNVCVCCLGLPGLQPSQWECTLVTTEVKVWWPPDYQEVKGSQSFRELVATTETHRLESIERALHRIWQPKLHVNNSQKDALIHSQQIAHVALRKIRSPE